MTPPSHGNLRPEDTPPPGLATPARGRFASLDVAGSAAGHTHAPPGDAPPHAGDDPDAALNALVARARSGDRDAFDEIVFLHRDQVHGACWNLVRDTDDAMDLAQEAFLRAWRALPGFGGRARFSTWLHRIVLNTAVDHLRRAARRRRHEVPGTTAPAGDDPRADAARARAEARGARPATQRETVHADELNRRLHMALAQLSGRQRDVFMLRHHHEMDLREVAETLLVSEGSVKRHLFRAQARLRVLMADLTDR